MGKLVQNGRYWMKAVTLGIIIGIVILPTKSLGAFQFESVVSEDLQTPIFYTTFHPIIFEVNISHLLDPNTKDLLNSATLSQLCRPQSPSANGCTLISSLNTFTYTTSNWQGDLSSGLPFRSIGYGFQQRMLSCDEILKHFFEPLATVSNHRMHWGNYRNALKRCVNDEVFWGYRELKTDNSELQNIFDQYLTFYSAFPIGGYTVSFESLKTTNAMQFNGFSALRSLSLIGHVSRTQMLLRALDLCSIGKFPLFLVSQSELVGALQNISGPVSGRSLVFSTDYLEMPHLPITECALVDNETVIVRTLVPLKPKDSDFKIKRIRALPFIKGFNRLTKENNLCSMKDVEGEYIYDSNSGFLQKSNCKGDLCFISKEKLSYQKSNPCLNAIINGSATVTNDNETNHHCTAFCTPVSTNLLPIFTRVTSDVIRVINDWWDKDIGEFDIFISCKGNPFKILRAKPERGDAVHVTLPCDCKLVHKLEEFHAEYPCRNGTVEIQEIYVSLPEDNDNGKASTDTSATEKSENPSYTAAIQESHGFLIGLSILMGICGTVSLAWQIFLCYVGNRQIKAKQVSCSCASDSVPIANASANGHDNDIYRVTYTPQK